MRIRHERPMSELAFRVRAPLGLKLTDGEVIQVHEWSLQSLTFPDDVDILPTSAILIIPFQGVDIRFPARFVHGTGKREMMFKDLSGRQRETLALFYRSILSGRMAATNEIITSLDTPVDLVPMEETEDEQMETKTKVASRGLRAAFSLTLYTLTALAVFSIVGGQVWKKLNVIPLSNGFISAPITPHFSASGAYVDKVLVERGEAVKLGQKLIELSDPNRDYDVDRTRAEIALADQRLAEARDGLLVFNQGIERERHVLWREFRRAVTRRSLQDFLSNYSLSEVRAAWFALSDFEVELQALTGDFGEELLRKRQLIEEREKQYRWLKRELSSKKGAANSIDIVATHDGVVEEIYVFEDQFVQLGATIINIESDAQRTAVGWLTDQRADTVYIGMPAKILFNRGSGRQSVPGTVTNIVSGAHPNAQNRYGMIVTVAADKIEIAETRAMFLPNSPVRIHLSRGLLNGFWGG